MLEIFQNEGNSAMFKAVLSYKEVDPRKHLNEVLCRQQGDIPTVVTIDGEQISYSTKAIYLHEKLRPLLEISYEQDKKERIQNNLLKEKFTNLNGELDIDSYIYAKERQQQEIVQTESYSDVLAAEEEAKRQKLLAELIQEDRWKEEERLRLMTPAEFVSAKRAEEFAKVPNVLSDSPDNDWMYPEEYNFKAREEHREEK